MIRVENVSYDVGQKRILNQINLSVESQEIVGVIGPNGSGKSTLLKNIYKELKPSEGLIYLNGKSLSAYKRKELAKSLAVVSQENEMEFDFTVLEMVEMGRYAYQTFLESTGDKDQRICQDALESVGLLSLKDRSFQSLSGGEKQRVYLALALAQQSGILILDEPTNHLDIQYQIAIMDLLKMQQKKTVLLSLHDMNLAARYCDKIIVMQSGNLVAYGKPEQVLTKERIREVFSVEADIRKDSKNHLQIYFTGCTTK